MNVIKSLGLVGLAATGLFAAQAFATPCPTAPATGIQTQGSPVCIAPEGLDASPSGLNDYFGPGGIRVVSGPGINVYHGQQQPSAYWSIGSTGKSENTLTLEIAGNASSNTFGIFDPTDPGNMLKLFTGGASAGWSASLQNLGNGNYIASLFDENGIIQSQTTAHFGVTNLFGYYLQGPGGTFFSAPGLNGGNPQVVAYQGDNATTLKTGNIQGLFQDNEYLLAWEDLPWASSDLDYNDFVVLVESVHPVPEPAALGMFGLGVLLIGGFTALRRRRCFNA